MKSHKIGFLVGLVTVLGLSSAWATPAQVQSDAREIAKWFSKEIAHMTAANAISAPLVPGDVRGILGVEVGVAGAVSVSDIDLDGFRALPLQEFNIENADFDARAAMVLPTVHAKVGLLGGFDLGIKIGAISFDDTENDAESSIKNTVLGVELRKRLMGEGVTGAVLPDISLNLAYDWASGDLTRKDSYNDGDLVANTRMTTEWNTSALSARVVASKQLLFITPFVGLGYSFLMGDAETSMNVNGTVDGATPVNVTSSATEKPGSDIFHVLGGLEISPLPLLRVGLAGLWSDEDWTAALTARVQFR